MRFPPAECGSPRGSAALSAKAAQRVNLRPPAVYTRGTTSAPRGGERENQVDPDALRDGLVSA